MNRIDARAEDIAPRVLRSMGRLGAWLARPWVRVAVRFALYFLLGGLPLWVPALLDAIIDAWAPVLKPEVVAELRSFRATLATVYRDAPPEVRAEMPPAVRGDSPFADPARAAMVLRDLPRLMGES